VESGDCGGIWWVWWDLVGVVGSGGIWRVLVVSAWARQGRVFQFWVLGSDGIWRNLVKSCLGAILARVELQA